MPSEKQFFDDLLDGLEASVFDDNPFSSPARSQQPLSPRGPPEPLSPKKSHFSQKHLQTPSKPAKHLNAKPRASLPTKSKQQAPKWVADAQKENIAQLLGGIEDWNDWTLDALSPPSKPKTSPVKQQQQHQNRIPISKQYLRFVVVHVEETMHPTSHRPCKVSGGIH